MQFNNDNQKQSYLFPIEPSLLSRLHSSLAFVSTHLFHFVRNYIVPTTCGIKNLDTIVIPIIIIIGNVII